MEKYWFQKVYNHTSQEHNTPPILELYFEGNRTILSEMTGHESQRKRERLPGGKPAEEALFSLRIDYRNRIQPAALESRSPQSGDDRRATTHDVPE